MPGSRTPVEALYLCGSSAGNGGGVNGAPGYIAANTICDDLRLKRAWTPLPPPEWGHCRDIITVDLGQCEKCAFVVV